MILNPNDWSRKTQKVLFGIALALAIVCMMGAGALWSQGKMAWPLGVVSVVCAGAALYLAYDIWWKKHATGEDTCKNKDGETCSSQNRGCPTTTNKDECGKCVNGYEMVGKYCKKTSKPSAATDKDKGKTKNKGK